MNKQEQAIVEMLDSIAALAESKGFVDPGHRKMVAEYADMLADRLKIGERDREQIHIAALLHDIGYLAVPRRLARKAELDEYELEVVNNHVTVGADILAKMTWLEDAASYVRHHHENIDGKGFPDGLAGDDIPLGAQVVGIAAYFVEELSKVLDEVNGFQKASDALLLKAGSRFDPEIVTIFVKEAETVFNSALAKFRNRAANLLARLVRNVRPDQIVLPVSGQVLDRLKKSLGRNVKFEQLVRFIEADPGLTLKVISVANSPAYSGVDAVQDARMAVLRVGMDVISDVLSSPEAHNLFPIHGQDRLAVYLMHRWRESLFQAMTGRVLAQATGIGVPAVCYYIGLLRDLGRSALLYAFHERGSVNELNEVEFNLLLELINQVAWPVSRELWEQAGIDKRIITLSETKLKPKEGEQPPPPVVKVLAAAEELARSNDECLPVKEMEVCYEDFKTVLSQGPLNLNETQMEKILAKILAVYKAVYRQ